MEQNTPIRHHIVPFLSTVNDANDYDLHDLIKEHLSFNQVDVMDTMSPSNIHVLFVPISNGKLRNTLLIELRFIFRPALKC